MSIAISDDFDADGRSDVLWRDESGSIHAWTGTTAGSFVDT